MKKRSLLALSLVSLVSLVGCGKDGASGAVKCSAATFDDLVSAQFGLYYIDSDIGDFGDYLYAEVSYSLEQVITGSYLDPEDDPEDYNWKLKGKFIAVQDLSSYSWSVDPDQGYTEEELEDYDFALEDAPLGYVSWAAAVYSGMKMGAYYESLCEPTEDPETGELIPSGYSVSFTTAPAVTLKYSETEEEPVEIAPAEEGEEPGEGTLVIKSSMTQSMGYADKYGFATYSFESQTQSQSCKEDKSLNGKYSYTAEYKVRYFNPAEDEGR